MLNRETVQGTRSTLTPRAVPLDAVEPPRSTLAAGALLLVLGIWGALIPFVGPYFGYAFGSHVAWSYSTNRLWLDILPGAGAVIAGLFMLGATSRRSGALAAWLAVAAGAWFVVGPAVSLSWEHVAGPIGVPLGGPTLRLLEWVGYFYGTGALIVALASYAGGRFASMPPVNATLAASDPVSAYTPAPGDPADSAAPPADSPNTRRRVAGPRERLGMRRGEEIQQRRHRSNVG